MNLYNSTSVMTTNTLKGIVILTVLINHYLNMNIAGNCGGFANLFISLFFALSGYGLFYSFNRRYIDKLSFRELLEFYYERFLRIFPLLWVAWFVQLLVSNGKISFWIPFGIHGTGHFWFIPALLQCYILSPFIYLGIKRHLNFTILILAGAVFIINIFSAFNLLPGWVCNLFEFTNSIYCHIYFLHILIFMFGFLTPVLFAKLKLHSEDTNNTKNVSFWLFGSGVLLFMVIAKYMGQFLSTFKIAFAVVPLFPLALLYIYALKNQIKNGFFAFIGSISYPIYLFHFSLYIFISNIGGFKENSFLEFIVHLILLPFFIYFCIHLQQFGYFMANQIRKVAYIFR